jgi:type VI secretion system secreted protein Hcp
MAAVDYFLKLDGIQGESQDDKHANEIDVQSWSWGESNSGTHAGGGGGGAGKVAMQDFHFTMSLNKASPLLFQSCANGTHIKKAVLTCRKAGKEQQEYLLINFEDLLVSSYQTGGSGGDIVPTEQISLNFAKIEFQYKPQKADGSLDGAIIKHYDLKKMTGG